MKSKNLIDQVELLGAYYMAVGALVDTVKGVSAESCDATCRIMNDSQPDS